MDYKGYRVNDAFVDASGNILWKETGNGKFIIAVKDGKEYFIKKNVNFRRPSKDLATVLRLEMMGEANRLETKQAKLAVLMKPLSFDTDHIAIEESNFWDNDDNLFVTVTRFLKDAVDNRSDFSKESPETKRQIFIQMATLLQKLHNVGVIHGDLKEPNFLFKKVEGGYTIYLIDFDASYPASEVPEFDAVPYSPGYQSPEIVCYSASENPEMAELLTGETDIFTLGLIFHSIWTHKLPGCPLKEMSVGEALARGEENKPILDKRLDEFIGERRHATYLSLINWMLTRLPDKRPNDTQLLAVLNDEENVPDEYIVGKDYKTYESLWSVHRNKAIFDVEQLISAGVVYFRHATDGFKYAVKVNDEEEVIMTIDDVLERGLLKEQDIITCEPFPEHDIVFASHDVLKSKDIHAIEQLESDRQYKVVFTSGISFYWSYKHLVEEGIAHFVVKASSVRFGEPWPEDNAEYASDDYFTEKHIESIERIIEGDNKLYLVTYNDGRPPRKIFGKTMLLLGLMNLKR